MSEDALIGGVGGLAIGLALGRGQTGIQIPSTVYVESYDFLASGFMDVDVSSKQLIAPQGARAVLIRSPNTNTATIWLGGSTVRVGDGLPLYAGENLMLAIKNASALYAVAEAGVQKLYLFFVGVRE